MDKIKAAVLIELDEHQKEELEAVRHRLREMAEKLEQLEQNQK